MSLPHTDVLLLIILFNWMSNFPKCNVLKLLMLYYILCMFLRHSSSDMVKKIKVDDVYFTSRVFVSSRSFIQQEVCEGTKRVLNPHSSEVFSPGITFKICHTFCRKGPSINDVRSLGGVSKNLMLLNKISKIYNIKVWQKGKVGVKKTWRHL